MRMDSPKTSGKRIVEQSRIKTKKLQQKEQAKTITNS